MVFVLLASISFYIIKLRYSALVQEEKQVATNMAESARSRLQQSLQYSLSATQALTLTIDQDGHVHHFDSIAAYILNSNKYMDALQLVPGGVIRHIYPIAGHEAALGYDILSDSSRNKEAFKAIKKKELFFAGPLPLRQGGMAVVGRLPVYRKNRFWGFSAVIVRLPTLLQAAGIDTSGQSGYYFQLSKVNPDTNIEEYFLPERGNSIRQQDISVAVPNGEWKLSITPVNDSKTFSGIFPISIFALILSLTGSVFAVYLTRTPARLKRLVKRKTAELALDISERKKVEDELLKSREDLRQLSNHIENIREEERLHISREIHDELGQQLTVLKMDVSRLEKKLEDAGDLVSDEISRIIRAINQMVVTVRKISSELRPGLLDDLGLVAALEWYAHDFGKHSAIKTSFMTNLGDDKFSKQLNIGLFRIFQESLTNVARHSQATRVDVSFMRHGQYVLLLIEDNGKGFSPAIVNSKKTLGILGMQERAIMMGGTYKIDSSPDRGAIIEVAVPLLISTPVAEPISQL